MRYLKLDLTDTNSPIVTKIIATKSLDELTKAEIADYTNDDRLQPCFGRLPSECFGLIKEGDCRSITWSPGDGGTYTIAFYGPDNNETRQKMRGEVFTANALSFLSGNIED